MACLFRGFGILSLALKGDKTRINNEIRSPEVRVVLDDGGSLGVISIGEALREAVSRGLDLVEISPNAVPPVAKITDFGKYQYIENKREKEAKSKQHSVETKNLQVKIATGDHDLKRKAEMASKFLSEGHRVKIELFLKGRAKYLNKDFHKERLNRILAQVKEEHKIADGPKESPKGMMIIIERAKK